MLRSLALKFRTAIGAAFGVQSSGARVHLRGERSYRVLLEKANDGIVVTDAEPRILDVNPRLCELLGYRREELVGRPYAVLLPGDELERRPLTYPEVFAGHSVLIERRYRRKDGTAVTVELSAARVDEERALCIVRDIGERKAAEAALAARERDYRLLMEEAYDAVLLIDPEFRIVDANRAACQLLGYPREALLGRPYASLVQAEDLERTPLQFDATFAGINVVLERRYRRSDGTTADGELTATRIDERRVQVIIRDATQRKRAEAALRDSERKYRLLMEEAHDAILVVNPEYMIEDANRSACRLFGYPRAELIGRLYSSLVDRDDLRRLPLQVTNALQGRPLVQERRYRCRDGTLVQTEVSLARIDARRVQHIIRDVTERKLAEAAVREREELARTLLGAVFDGIVMHEDGIIVEVNPAYERMVGFSRAELLGRDVMSLVAPESLETVRRVRASDSGGPFEAVALHKDGHRVHYECVAVTRKLEGRRVRIAALRDITERKRAEAVLQEREARLREAQQVAKLGSWALDLATNTLVVTEEFSRILRLEPHEPELQVERVWPVVHPDDLERIQQLHQDVLAGRTDAFDIEFHLRCEAGPPLTLHTQAAVVRDNEGRPVRMVGTTQDISERKALEHQLAQAMKMEAIGKLTGGVAHDFNNLLTVILGNLRMLERDGHRGDELLAEALGAAERGSDLVQRLLVYGRRTPLHSEPVSVNGLIGDMAGLLQRTLGEPVEVRTQLDETLWTALTDRSQLETALLNLALNARDAMPNGGCLEIATANRTLEPQRGGGTPVETGDYVRLTVRDTGTGMTPEVLERVFDPFFTTKAVGQGTGLGLSMVYGFAEQCGGFVAIESTPGTGTTVALHLPRTHESPDAPDAQPAESTGDVAGRLVLLVEDDPVVRRTVLRMLESLGHRVVDVPNGPEALRRLEALANVELLITDVVMPEGLSGIELAQAARERRPHLPVVLTTGYAPTEEVRGCNPCAPWPMLLKPFGLYELQRMLGEVLRDPARPA